MTIEQPAHKSVLLDEAVEALVQDPAGIYIDGTFGRGGHSERILKLLNDDGRLLAIDRDLEAIETARNRFVGDPRFEVAHADFAQLAHLVTERGWQQKVSGVLLDLGVSSPQLDQAERGFSFMSDGPLDMRMDTSCGASAADLVAQLSAEELANIFRRYGEERYAKRIARAIVEAREETPIVTTKHFSDLVTEANPAWEKHKHPATRVFQAMRIAVNGELDQLQQVLPQALDILAIGGRMVLISFHSLEDREVKCFMRDQERGQQLPKGIPVLEEATGKRVKRIGKAKKPTALEVEFNARARSAILRVAEKIA